MTHTYYIGLDVHKETIARQETIAIAHATGGNREDAVYHGTCGGSVPVAERALRKLAEKLKVEFRALKVCDGAHGKGRIFWMLKSKGRPLSRIFWMLKSEDPFHSVTLFIEIQGLPPFTARLVLPVLTVGIPAGELAQ